MSESEGLEGSCRAALLLSARRGWSPTSPATSLNFDAGPIRPIKDVTDRKKNIKRMSQKLCQM